MSVNMVGIIVCVAIVVCGMGAYFIGRTQGFEWAITHTHIEIRVIKEEEENEQTTAESR